MRIRQKSKRKKIKKEIRIKSGFWESSQQVELHHDSPLFTSSSVYGFVFLFQIVQHKQMTPRVTLMPPECICIFNRYLAYTINFDVFWVWAGGRGGRVLPLLSNILKKNILYKHEHNRTHKYEHAETSQCPEINQLKKMC